MRFLKLIIFSLFLFLPAISHGADVFYSVGQTASDLKTGTPTVTIASGVATFSAAQTGNVGVGDRVTYNTTSIAYIASKTSTTVWNLVTATGAAPGDVTAQTVDSITREYTSLSAAEAGASDVNHLNTTDLTSGGGFVLNLPCYYDTGADTTVVTINGWTTGASNYIKIYAPNNTSTEVNQSQRHSGKWDDGKYNLNLTASGAYFYGIRSYEDYVRIDGIQIMLIGESTSEAFAILFYNTSVVSEISLSNNIVRGSLSAGAATTGIVIGDSGINAKIWNNIVYGWDLNATSRGLSIYSNTTYLYNNTVYGANVCYRRTTGGSVIAKNNIAQSCVDGYNGTFDASSDYNISNVVSDAPSPSYRSGLATAVTFADATNADFHLADSDTGAKNFGANLFADAGLAVTTDIDGQGRPNSATLFDIGADEATTSVFYSVGQNTTDHKTGSPTLTIASGTGTFSVAQTASNMGVGDKVTYDTSTVAYISQKISTTQWKFTTATGGVPANITDSAVVSIAHAYASISTAEAGAPDASHLNTMDLVVGNYQINFPCYYDTGADTTAVTISGWTTGASNYIKIYTPNNTSTEVNVSQRHSGKWNDSTYVFHNNDSATNGIRVAEDYVRIDGLQIKVTATGTNNRYGIDFSNITATNNDLRFSNLIIRGVSSSTGLVAGMYSDTGTPNITVWNSIVYDFVNGTDDTQVGLRFSGANINIYNSTVYNCYAAGVMRDSGTMTVKNTAVFGSNNDFSGTITVDYCASDDGDGTNAVTPANWSAVFVDYANGDFHLKASDVSLKNAGVSDPGSGLFSNDIDDQHRSGGPDGTPWDIGADEYVGTIVNSPDLPGGSKMKINMSLTDKMTSGLVGMWSFDGPDVSGATAYDRSGLANNGTITGAVVAIGKRGQALSFDGTGDFVTVPDNVNLDGLSSMSWSFWIKLSDTGTAIRGIMNKYVTSVGGRSYDIFVDSSEDVNLRVSADGTANEIQIATGADLDTNWNHVVVVFNGGVFDVYKNGQVVADDGDFSSHLSVYGGTDSLDIGRTYGGDIMIGQLDEVRIYNRALSADEAGDLYRLGQAKIRR